MQLPQVEVPPKTKTRFGFRRKFSRLLSEKPYRRKRLFIRLPSGATVAVFGQSDITRQGFSLFP